MEVRIRLQRAGRSAKKRYNFRIVVMSKKAPRESKYLDLLGYYDPAKQPAVLSVNHEKVEKWLKKGAQMSDTVRSLVVKSKKTNNS
jgi:small subunit ribosomal protein S16